jgi:hypothetical protein
LEEVTHFFSVYKDLESNPCIRVVPAAAGEQEAVE